MADLHVEETGPADAPTILFVHGAVVAGWMWHAQVADLARDHHCLIPDLPGHGRSPARGPFSIPLATQLLAELITSRAHHRRAHVVGLSLGGALTLDLMARAGHLIDRAVISGPTGGPLPHFITRATGLLLPLMRREFMLRRNARYLRLPDDLYATFATAQRAFSTETYTAVMRSVDGFRIPASLSGATTPLLAVVGSREPGHLRRQAQHAVALVPGAVGRIAPGGTHGWNAEQPVLFNRMIRAWTSGTPLPVELTALPST